MRILFLGGFFPKEMFHEIMNNSRGAIANANNLLQWGIIDGLYSLGVIQRKFSYPQVGAFPVRYKSFYFRGNADYDCGSFFNVIGFKHIDRFFKSKRFLKKQLENSETPLTVVVYDLHIPYLLALSQLKRKYFFHICLIVPDLHGNTGEPNGIIHLIWRGFEKCVLSKTLSDIDSFVLLSEHMKEKLPIGNKPNVVVEGIYQTHGTDITEWTMEQNRKVLFYSGAVDERNGILNLLKAFSMIVDAEYRLVICGDGSERDAVIAAAKKDNRIDYKGQLSHEDVIALQKKSSLLINPRPPEGEFTKYSFPSKTMEYFASGIPVLMYKLEGIPNEYYQYCFSLQDNSPTALSQAIVEIHHIDLDLRNEKGKNAREFILKNKNPKVQVLKLVEMINSSINEVTSDKCCC